MKKRSGYVLILVTSAIISVPGVTRGHSGQTSASCAQVIERLERETQAFDRDVQAQSLDFLKSDVTDTALSGIRRRLAGKPTSEALFDLKDKKEKFDSWAETVRNAGITLKDLQQCLATPGCSRIEFAKRQHQVLARWIQSLGNEAINAATERVNKAASLIQGYATRTLSLAMDSALTGVNNCTAQFEQSVMSTSAPVTTSAPTSGTSPAGTGGGSSAGGAGGWIATIAGGAAAAVAGVMLADKLFPVEDVSSADSARPSSPTSTSTPTPTPTTASCSFQSGCILNVLYDGTLARATNFNVIFSTPSGTCTFPRTVCYGPGCDGDPPSVRTSSRQLTTLPRSLGTVSVSLAQAPSTTPSGISRTVNLATCQPDTIRFP